MAFADSSTYRDAQSLRALYDQNLELPLPPYLAATRTLSDALSRSPQPPATLAETLALLSSLQRTLASTLPPNAALALAAGPAAFQRELPSALGPDAPAAGMKAALAAADEAFVKTRNDARARLARHAARFVRPGMTLVVPTPSSENVAAMLRAAADADVSFRVLFLRGSKPTKDLSAYLREREVPVAYISAARLGSVLGAGAGAANPQERRTWPVGQTIVVAGAAVLLSSGGAVTSAATRTAAAVAQAHEREVWIAAETAKCVRETGADDGVTDAELQWDASDEQESASNPDDAALEILPAELITGVLTEDGPRSTSAVAEEAVRQWF